MVSNKKRRLNPATTPETQHISAFAARKFLRGGIQAAPQDESDSSHERLSSQQEEPALSKSAEALTKSQVSSSEREQRPARESNEPAAVEYDSDASLDDDTSRLQAAEDLPVPPLFKLSLTNLKLGKKGISQSKNGTTAVKLTSGEKLVVLGEYGLSVRTGQVTILGAVLQPSDTIYHVYAFTTHSLPVIRPSPSETPTSEICLHDIDSGIYALGALSPLYRRLGIENADSDQGKSRGRRKSSFTILFSNEDAPRRSYLQPIVSPAEWNEALAASAARNITAKPEPRKAPKATAAPKLTTMICGPKSSGKSTFARLLTNRLLSGRSGYPSKSAGIIFLDIDPGQPEYSPPGQLSLIHLNELNLGPPYTHPHASTPGRRVLRAHSIVANTPSFNLEYYMICIKDLFSHYRHFTSSHPNCPLIINTPGWVLGTGLQILVDLIKECHPMELIYMSIEGPEEVITNLQEASQDSDAIITRLPSQSSDFTTRTAAHLRYMQAMSYFHLPISMTTASLATKGQPTSPHWTPEPLTSIPPWEVSYTGPNAGISGVLFLGEHPTPDMVVETINGSTLAVLAIEEDAAIFSNSNSNSNSNNNEDSTIQFTPQTNIPYFTPSAARNLDPRSCHTLGHTLVRGIDTARRKLHLLTPIPAEEIADADQSGMKIVLLSGKLDTPGWAYTEELYRRDAGGVDGNEGGDVGNAAMQGDDDLFKDIPWIERIHGDQGRGVGSRVWRVRRDLGKSGNAD